MSEPAVGSSLVWQGLGDLSGVKFENDNLWSSFSSMEKIYQCGPVLFGYATTLDRQPQVATVLRDLSVVILITLGVFFFCAEPLTGPYSSLNFSLAGIFFSSKAFLCRGIHQASHKKVISKGAVPRHFIGYLFLIQHLLLMVIAVSVIVKIYTHLAF